MVAHVEEVQVGSDMVAKVVQMAEMAADDGLIEHNGPSTVAESDLEVVEVVQLVLVGGGCNDFQTGSNPDFRPWRPRDVWLACHLI